MLIRSIVAFVLGLSAQPLLAAEAPVHGKCMTSKSELAPAAHAIEWWLDKDGRGEAKVQINDDVYDGTVIGPRDHGDSWQINVLFTRDSHGEKKKTELAVFGLKDSFIMIGANFQQFDGLRVLKSIEPTTEILCITD
ncbi:hypothetical protein ACEUZ9_002875 [Paracoccus litorisediminis]|uniref:hypothetical protein n=1 Tax=Paracoccus litorisediminis TaxID=2006130 RepID=UPI003732B894